MVNMCVTVFWKSKIVINTTERLRKIYTSDSHRYHLSLLLGEELAQASAGVGLTGLSVQMTAFFDLAIWLKLFNMLAHSL